MHMWDEVNFTPQGIVFLQEDWGELEGLLVLGKADNAAVDD